MLKFASVIFMNMHVDVGVNLVCVGISALFKYYN